MLMNIVNDTKFSNLMNEHVKELIIYMFEAQQNFGILCKLDYVTFEPELPENIKSDFRDVTLFFLAGYTYESARLEDGYLIFEAGFGSENIGSVVSVPLSSILQLIVDETPLFISLATPKEHQPEASNEPASENANEGVQNSMAAFLSNPENQKFKK